jgi:amyloid beta precursor protein binding protein 1
MQHGGSLPKSSEERQQFKKGVLALKVKGDEENFDEAEAQAYRCWTETKVFVVPSLSRGLV